MNDDLPSIPNDQFRLMFEDPQFCCWENEWAVIGPDHLVPAHSQITVRKADGSCVPVQVSEHLGARTVTHRAGSYLSSIRPMTRYVVARIADPLQE